MVEGSEAFHGYLWLVARHQLMPCNPCVSVHLAMDSVHYVYVYISSKSNVCSIVHSQSLNPLVGLWSLSVAVAAAVPPPAAAAAAAAFSAACCVLLLLLPGLPSALPRSPTPLTRVVSRDAVEPRVAAADVAVDAQVAHDIHVHLALCRHVEPDQRVSRRHRTAVEHPAVLHGIVNVGRVRVRPDNSEAALRAVA